MACRCLDLEAMQRDMDRLVEASGKASRLSYYDERVLENLARVAAPVPTTMYYPQEDLPEKIKNQNSEASDAIVSLSDAIFAAEEALAEEMKKAREEDKEWHDG